MTSRSFLSLQNPETKLLFLVHLLHVLLFLVTLSIFVVGELKLEQKWGIEPTKAGSIQSTVNAVLQATFTACLALLFWLSQKFAISQIFRIARDLLAMHFTIQAWEGFTSAGLAIYHLASSRTPGLRRQIGILAAISLYFAASSALQITSSGVLGIEVYNVPTSMVSTAALNSLGSFLGFDSTPGELAEPPSSNEDTSAVNRGIWQASRMSMYMAGANDTLNPGLDGRILHDTLSGLDTSAFEMALVNATGMNVRCNQVPNAIYTAFILPVNSTNFTQAIRADQSGDIDGTNLDYLATLWINVTLPPPPYWNLSELTISRSLVTDVFQQPLIYDEELTPRVYMQPWSFPLNESVPFGHHQVVMLLTGGSEYLVSGTNGLGRTYNFTGNFSLENTFCFKCRDGTCGEPSYSSLNCNPSRFLGSVQVRLPLLINYSKPKKINVVSIASFQAIGCDFWTTEEPVNITTYGLIAGSTQNWNGTLRPPRAWSDFAWTPQSPMTMDRQFLTIFSPSAPGDLPDQSTIPIAELGLSPSERLLSRLLTPVAGIPNNVSIETLEDAMEHYAASYFWAFASTCDNANPLPLATSYANEGCQYFRGAGDPDNVAFTQRTGRNATLLTTETRARFAIVQWRAQTSVGLSFALAILAWVLMWPNSSTNNIPAGSAPVLKGGLGRHEDAILGSPTPNFRGHQSQRIAPEGEAEACSAVTETTSTRTGGTIVEGTSRFVGADAPQSRIQEAGLIDIIQLMQHSSLPRLMGTSDSSYQSCANIRVRYGVDKVEGHVNLDLGD